MANEKNTTQAKPNTTHKKGPKRRSVSGNVAITTDLFMLRAAKVIKHDSGATENAHPEDQPNEFTKYDHCHPYRTLDKQGKLQDKCVPIAGHFHMIEVEPSEDPNEPPKIISCSGPMVMGVREVKGRKVMQPVPANGYDDHTHEVEYVRSGEFQASKLNVEAAAVQAKNAALVNPALAGVTEIDSTK